MLKFEFKDRCFVLIVKDVNSGSGEMVGLGMAHTSSSFAI